MMESPAVAAAAPRVTYLNHPEIIRRVQEVVQNWLPADAVILIVSSGDDKILNLGGRRAWHFPQNKDGAHSGQNPADSAAAISQLEALRAKGAEFFIVPKTVAWWLTRYDGLRKHLESQHRLFVRLDDSCVIFQLSSPGIDFGQGPVHDKTAGYQYFVTQIGELASTLLPSDATVLVVSGGDDALLKLGGAVAWHFPQMDTGHYGGHPADSAEAIAQLEQLRAKGADYLLIPSTAFWWHGHYMEFADYLASRCRLVTRQEHCCLIYDLRGATR